VEERLEALAVGGEVLFGSHADTRKARGVTCAVQRAAGVAVGQPQVTRKG
jgi:hypothetical protein